MFVHFRGKIEDIHRLLLLAEKEKKVRKGERGGGGGAHIAIPVALGCGAGHSGSVLEESHGSDGSHQFAMKTICSPSLPPLNSSLFLYLFSALSPSSRNIKGGSSG